MVEITYLAIAGIALAAMFFGYGFGLFEGRSQGYKKRKAEAEQEKKDEPPPESRSINMDDPGLLRVKNENGSLALDLDGRRVDTSSLSFPERRRLIEMLNLMRPWLEGRTTSAPSMAVSASPPQPAPVKSSFGETSTPAAQKSALPQVAKRAAPNDDRPAAPANSIVAQIDAILQAGMAGTPLEERGVFLAQSPDGGVIVFVGLTRYGGVDEVPDPEIKAAIRAAISEWERKYTPGL